MKEPRPGFCVLVVSTALAVGLIGSVPAAAPHAPPRYRVHELPTLGPDSHWSIPSDISENGIISGMAHIPGDTQNRWWGVRFTHGMIRMLPPPKGADVCWAHGVNDAGDIAGGCRRPGKPTIGVVWPGDKSKPAKLLRSPNGGDTFASDINNAGMAVGHYYDGVVPHGAVWKNKTFIPLAYWHEKDEVPTRINEAGDIVGSGQDLEGRFHSLIWVDGVPLSLGENSFARGINKHRDVVGQLQMPVNGEDPSALTWAPALWIGSWSRALVHGRGAAHDVNDRGWVVGEYVKASGGLEAFLFDGQRTYDLLSLVDSPRPLMTFTSAVGINNAGLIVVRGTMAGRDRAFLLKPILH